MQIKYNLDKLREILWSFYEVSGIRFILFDADCKKVLACPEDDCKFCKSMRNVECTSRKCSISDRKSLKKCTEQDGPFIYKCHAGLVEAALALRENESIIGYLMFGQVTDNADRKAVKKELCRYCSDYGIDSEEISNAVDEIPYMENAQILAAAKIMEACTSYIILKELITPESDKLFVMAKEYIDKHIADDIDIFDICKHLDISRTKLYEIFKKEIGVGISSYIRKRRMHQAKKLLKSTKLPVWKIAQSVGFSDYTYFGRVYKRTYGMSPRDYKKTDFK